MTMIKLHKIEICQKLIVGWIGCGTKIGGHGYIQELMNTLVLIWVGSDKLNSNTD